MNDGAGRLRARSRVRPDLDALAVRHGPVVAVAILGLALALRLPGLSGWWVNPDEGINYSILTQESFGAFWDEMFATTHPPLYYLVLRAMGEIGTDLTWLRSLALVSGCAAVWAFVLLGKDLVGDSAEGWLTGLVAGLLLAVSPVAIELSQVIRPYMLLVLLLALSLHFFLCYLERPSWGRLTLYVTCASLAVFLHYSAMLALGVIAMLLAADGAARGMSRPEWRRMVAAQAFPAAIIGVLYVLHLRRMMVSDHIDFAVEIWLTDYLIHAPVDAWLTLLGFHANLGGKVASAAATLMTLIGIVNAAVSRKPQLVLSAGGALVIATGFAALQLYPFGAGRHSAWLFPFVTPILAWLIGWLVMRSAEAPRRAALALGAVLAGLLLRSPLGTELAAPALPEHVIREEHVDAMADVLSPRSAPRLVVMSLETYRMLMPLYYRERQGARVSADGSYLHFRWGARDVVVLPGLDIAVRRNQVEQPNHLHTGTMRAASELQVPLPGDGETVLVLSGDWRRSVFDLSELAREAGLEGATQSVPGLVAITLDLEAYGRALGLVS